VAQLVNQNRIEVKIYLQAGARPVHSQVVGIGARRLRRFTVAPSRTLAEFQTRRFLHAEAAWRRLKAALPRTDNSWMHRARRDVCVALTCADTVTVVARVSGPASFPTAWSSLELAVWKFGAWW